MAAAVAQPARAVLLLVHPMPSCPPAIPPSPEMAQQSCSPFLDLIGSATCIKQGAEAVSLVGLKSRSASLLVGALRLSTRLPVGMPPHSHKLTLLLSPCAGHGCSFSSQKVYKTILFPSPTFTPASAAANDASDSAASSSAVPSLPPPVPVLLKHRFPKRYRHPHLDAQLTRLRVTSEARSLVRAARGGVCVPALRGVDVEAGIVGMEWIEGWSVREVLGGGAESDEVGGTDDEEGIADVTDAADEEAVPKPWAGLDLGSPLLPRSSQGLVTQADIHMCSRLVRTDGLAHWDAARPATPSRRHPRGFDHVQHDAPTLYSRRVRPGATDPALVPTRPSF